MTVHTKGYTNTTGWLPEEIEALRAATIRLTGPVIRFDWAFVARVHVPTRSALACMRQYLNVVRHMRTINISAASSGASGHADRTCLGPLCRGRVKFHSTHAGNRVCPRCARVNEITSPGEPLFECAPCGDINLLSGDQHLTARLK